MSDEIDVEPETFYFNVWNIAVKRNFKNAAIGLMCDGFDLLTALQRLRNAGKFEAIHHELDKRLREELMQILQDNDGIKIREWMVAFDAPGYEFVTKAGEWFLHCKEQRVK